jgi:hypothetical protein
MTETEWLAVTDARPMLAFVGQASPRKLRLFAVACWRQGAPGLLGGLDTQTEWRLDVAERHADGWADDEDLQLARGGGQMKGGETCVQDAAGAARETVALFGWLTDIATQPAPVAHSPSVQRGVFGRLRRAFFPDAPPAPDVPTQKRTQQAEQCALLRDIFGNPFRPVVVAAEWRTDTVRALAREMYEAREFSALPILADALQDAGCDSADILDHCRGDGPHVRGCWVVDLVLGKE